ncbi:signal peptidase I [Frankia sp. AgPm24]|uniref:signal peptidase I n=1 Tax=Frankia sp. AgPm24 TaxID=631128 RepID=UPI00200EF17A|nr:signal peptidase I [Frankia sp. AgPm24]MCK9922778.1 signal peptidase I [Frankia sp. AgPm24]
MNAASPGGHRPHSHADGDESNADGWAGADPLAAEPPHPSGALSATDDAGAGPGGRPPAGGSDAGGSDAGDTGRTDADRRPGSDPRGSGPRGRGSFLRELPVLVLVAFLLALLIKALLVQAFWIPSESMERTLLINDRVLVNKVVYHFRDVHRGEVVVFNGKGTGFDHQESIVPKPTNVVSRLVRDVQRLLGLGAPSETDFIKRVIGVGGDTVACCDAEGRVTVNGHPLDEPYVYENDYQRFGPVKVPDGYLWVMGDHRGASSDARQNGPVPQSKVVGRAFVRVWPLNRFGFLGVPGTFSGIPAAATSSSSRVTPRPSAPSPAALGPAGGSAGPADPSGSEPISADGPTLVALSIGVAPAWRSRRRWDQAAQVAGRGRDG